MLDDNDFCDKARVPNGIRNKQVIIQGFGNVGFHLARYLDMNGAKIIGVVERDAGIYCRGGIDIHAAKAHYMENGTFKGFDGCDEIETDDPTLLFRKPCDVLAPCAIDGAINLHNAPHI